MKARRCRCSASARCSFRPIAIRSRRMPSQRATITRICRTSLRADGCATCHVVTLNSRRALRRASPTARAALGYLHGNCGHCHNDAGALTGLELVLAQQADSAAQSSERTMQSLLGHSSRFRPQGADSAQRVARDGGTHVLTLRMKTNNPIARMPPLGVQQVDAEGVALIERWINQHLSNH